MRLLLLLFAVASTSVAQDQDNLTALIGMIFTPAPPIGGEGEVTPNTPSRNPDPISLQPVAPGSGSGIEGTGNCECVPYYLCNNGTVNKDGIGIIDIRIQDGPCQDYLSHCCEKDQTVTMPITPRPNINKPTGCGVRNPDGVGFRIKGDKDNEAQFGEFPWMVAILREEGVEGNSQKLLVYQCGASLIHPQVVLTAAHCVTAKEKKYKIRAGEWDTQTKNELYGHQDRDVKTIISHEEYYAGALFNDIALLILDSPLDIMENVDTICLPPYGADVIDYSRCYASGWGKDVFGKEGKYQVILKKIELPIVPRDVCQDNLRTTRLGKHFTLHKSFICAGGEAGKDTCKGDGGSPLVCPVPGLPGKYYQAGIVAWGISCGEENIPGVYANVPILADWINQQLISYEFDSSYYTYYLGKSADYPRYSTLFSRFGLKLIANTMTRYICILIFAIINNSLAQDDYSQAIEDIFIQNGSTTDFLGGFEEVTSPRSEGFGAVQKCGEGTDAGVHLCVDYYNCDADTRTIITSEEYDGTGLIDIRFGSNTCDDYLKVCCALPPSGVLPPELVTQPPTTGGQVTSAPVTPPTPPPVDVNTPEYCGIRNTNGIDFHITGNTNNEAEFGEFPWMLAILNKYPSTSDHLAVCGGSLIAPNVVLTGAHCVNTRTAGDLLVRAGEWDTQTERERYAYQERNIRTIIVHESFTTNNLFNDVALLILEEPFTRAPHIASICLPEQGTVFDSRECYTSGWGKNVFGLEGHYQVILKRIDLPTVPREKCQEDLRRTRLGHNFKLHNSFICAGGEAGKDACTGDGGSPLVCVDPNNPNRYLQAGIVAWGIGCGERDIPGVYADVGRFRSWIDQQLAAYNINPSSYTQ